MRYIKISVLFLIGLMIFGGSIGAKSMPKHISQYVHRVWKAENGLPQNTITAITQTTDGYLWLGTRAGVIRFDGVRFTVFNKENTPEMKDDNIWTLCADPNGGLWIGTNFGGLLHYRDNKLRSYTTQEGLSDNGIWSLYYDPDGTLWIGTSGGGLNYYRQGEFGKVTIADGLSSDYIWSTYRDSQGALWIGTDGGGLNRMLNGAVTQYNYTNGFPADYVFAITEDDAGALWFATEAGLFKYSNERFTRFTTDDGLAGNIVWTMLYDSHSNLWIGTDGEGLNLFRGGHFSIYNESMGLSSDLIACLYEDREHNVWVGTKGGGLNQFIDGVITTYTEKEGLSYDFVYSVYGDEEDNLWIGTGNGGLCKFRQGEFISYTTADGLSDDIILAVCGSQRGGVWLGTDGGGLDYWSEERIEHYSDQQGLPSNTIWSLFEDRQGTLWIGTDGGGLSSLTDGEFRHYGYEYGVNSEFISEIYEDHSGVIWIATRDVGLYRYQDGIFKQFTIEDGLLSDIVWSIHEDQAHTFWIGTSEGINRINRGGISSYDRKDGLFDDIVYSILEDDAGYLWMSGNRGIYRIERAAFERYDQGQIRAIPYLSFGIADGMKANECNYGTPSGWRTGDGHLWFPTIKGVSMIDPTRVIQNDLIPQVTIERVKIDGREYSPDSVIEVPPGYGNIEIQYTALSFVDAQKVFFRYRLENYNSDWIDARRRREAFYTNIPPGEYTFRVIACNNDGIWNETGATLKIVLKPHYYQQAWFRLLMVLGLVGLGAGIYYLRVRQLVKREKELNRRVTEAVEQIRTLKGLIPICASCKKIRDDSGYWNQLESFISEHSDVEFSHGICPECMRKLYPDYVTDKKEKTNSGESKA